ncbi:MAG: hypothetical protein Q7R33_03580 [Nitrosarchaeum sp.]|nr:hypothetical protein [Nitrosarchaeum sp.]
MSVLNLKEKGNCIEEIVNAIVAGYRDDLILEDLATAIEEEKVTKEQFQAAIEGLKLYAARFASSVENITTAMTQFEFNEKSSILKNRPMNLAQQVMNDVDGFSNASKEFYDEDEPIDEKQADIKKPAPAQAAVVPTKKVEKPEVKKPL